MKTKLLKKIRKKFSWKCKNNGIVVVDNGSKRAYSFESIQYAALKMAVEIIGTIEYSSFIRTREVRLYNKARRIIAK